MPTVSQYGSWKSPITSELIVSKTIGLGSVLFDGDDVYWTELRPMEGGRCVVVRQTADGKTTGITPQPFYARTRVHEYGGRPFTVWRGTVYFSNFLDQRVYRQDGSAVPRPITPDAPLRYADYVIDHHRNRMICVREDHRTKYGREATPDEVVNSIVALNLNENPDGGTVLVAGNDFYSSPRLSPDGARLAWLTWNHPNMPWDGTELWVANVNAASSLEHAQRVAGGPEESVFQPEWSPDGVLHFVSDRSGWWNLYRWSHEHGIESLCPMDAEFGKPQWGFGMTTYAFESPTTVLCTVNLRNTWRLARLHTPTGRLAWIDVPYTTLDNPQYANGKLAFNAASPTEFPCIVLMEVGHGAGGSSAPHCEILRRASDITVPRDYISVPRAVEFPTEGGLTAHAFFYPPRNPEFVAPDGEKPPLLVISHGGPTSARTAVLNLEYQYWTSRGFAILDVNYGGSTGYGRAYRLRLNGNWGVVDLDDCVNGARWLVERGEVDGNRVAIRGGSAGGYTTLCALAFRDFFKAGACTCGLSELETFVKDTHKFESRYLHRLIGPYPERRDLYRARSPLHYADRINAPLILFQGLEDKIVPPNQHEMIFQAVRKKGIPTASLNFEGEQHGFRKAETIKRVLEAELYFYGRVFGFKPADEIEPVRIENLD